MRAMFSWQVTSKITNVINFIDCTNDGMDALMICHIQQDSSMKNYGKL
jgi:hypothetical protein